jgi:hypothetical protein
MKIKTFYSEVLNDWKDFDDEVNKFMATVNVASILVAESLSTKEYSHTVTVVYEDIDNE